MQQDYLESYGTVFLPVVCSRLFTEHPWIHSNLIKLKDM
jgi:hypothetical protein